MNQSIGYATPCQTSTQNEFSPTYAPDDFLHELRQPLSVIDAVAYYLELTCKDEQISAHLQRIQAMVEEANRIVAKALQPVPAC